MPNTREKLIELRREGEEIAENFCFSRQECCQCPYDTPNGCQEGLIADHLIANGVTVQGWIPVTERLPEEGADVLGYMSDEYESRIFPANYANGVWFDCFFDVCLSSVTHWMPLPQPPEGA